MNLLTRIRNTGSRDISTVDDYAELFKFGNAWYSYGLGASITQTLAGGPPTEPPAGTFVGLASQAYQANGIVFACMLVRQLLFSSIRFTWQITDGRPSELFSAPRGDRELELLQRPWTGGTTQDLLSRTLQDADLAGNAYWFRDGNELVRLRPDWVEIVLEERTVRGGAIEPGSGQVGWRIRGYLYTEGGPTSGNRSVGFLPNEIAHFAPIPDPLYSYRGMSWLTPILREIGADQAMTRHEARFFDLGATPNMVIKHAPGATEERVKRWAEQFQDRFGGWQNAYKTLNLYPGADATVVGANMRQIDFKAVRGAGETRIAAAAGVPPIIVGLSEGLAASTYCGTYNEAVWTTRGIVKLGEIKPGDAIWSFIDGRIEARKVTWHSQTGTKPVYTIKTKNRTIRFTDNHPILVRVPGSSRTGSNAERAPSLAWRRVDELQVGDRVVQAQRLPDQALTRLPNGAVATTDILQWLGAYTGDGCLNRGGGIRMCIPLKDRAREHYEALALRLFTKQLSWATPGRRAKDGLTDEMVRLHHSGLSARQIVEQMGLSIQPTSVRDRIRHATREYVPRTAQISIREARNSFQFNSTAAVRWHHDMGITGTAKTKKLPGWIFELTEELRLAYLAGLVDTDGWVGTDGRLRIQLANHNLVQSVRMLMISCGIACSNVGRQEFKADVLPNPGHHATYESWHFTASSAVEVARIPFADPLYRHRVETNQHRHRPGGRDAAKAGLHEGLGFYTVRSIEIGEAEAVYDIEVEDGHSFLVDGVVVHNSNYGQARRRLSDGTAHPLWQNLAGSMERILTRPRQDCRLWYDCSDVPFLREDEGEVATIGATKASTISTYITSGFTPESAVAAVESGDLRLLEHTGLTSVQLMEPGENNQPEETPTTEEPQPPSEETPVEEGA